MQAALVELGCAATMAFGTESFTDGLDLIVLAIIGFGASTAAAAMSAALFGGSGADWVGAGSGADAAMIDRKVEIVDHGLALHSGHLEDPLEILRRLGGREFAAIPATILPAPTQPAVLLPR